MPALRNTTWMQTWPSPSRNRCRALVLPLAARREQTRRIGQTGADGNGGHGGDADRTGPPLPLHRGIPWSAYCSRRQVDHPWLVGYTPSGSDQVSALAWGRISTQGSPLRNSSRACGRVVVSTCCNAALLLFPSRSQITWGGGPCASSHSVIPSTPDGRFPERRNPGPGSARCSGPPHWFGLFVMRDQAMHPC